ncbi:MAG TPA: bifunctional oligoribonuclease/PAP phosphatase NrnA [Acidobacteriaceae bacterium]|jgi:phosphoesterase RecJ-like protein|nr:bifunctional oligoribonuclease/PAP phosphatase NrnA [Acidobacteriaceae bacterium]
MRSESIAHILRILRENDTFLVTSHARPDGDAIGSALGFQHLLEGLGKSVTVAFADPIPSMYHCLPGVHRIVHQMPQHPPEVAIVLECDSIERTGFARIDAGMILNIDHHQSGRTFGHVNWIDPEACAVGAMVYDLAVASSVNITPSMASCLYTAVLTDTGSFTYASTGAETFGLAEHLLERGADANGIAQSIYFSNPASKLRVLGTALTNLEIDDEIAWTFVSRTEMDAAGAIAEDCEGIVNHLISIAGIRAAVFLRELPVGDCFRLNLRSKGSVDVAEVAERFGGGGHRNASGCTVDGSLAEVVPRMLNELRSACRSGCATLIA